MSMHDLFGGVDDPVTEACRMLAEHDLVVVPGSVMRECMNVLHILACDTESVEECLELQALIHHIEAAWAHCMPPNAKSEPTAPLLAQVGSTDGLGGAVPPAPTFEGNSDGNT